LLADSQEAASSRCAATDAELATYLRIEEAGAAGGLK
jgi:hypothetical protein